MSSYILSYASYATGTHGRGGGKSLVGPLDFFYVALFPGRLYLILCYICMCYHLMLEQARSPSVKWFSKDD